MTAWTRRRLNTIMAQAGHGERRLARNRAASLAHGTRRRRRVVRVWTQRGR